MGKIKQNQIKPNGHKDKQLVSGRKENKQIKHTKQQKQNDDLNKKSISQGVGSLKENKGKQTVSSKLFDKIGYLIKDENMLLRALTHPSKCKENYQRLEFLGDSILNFLVGEFLFKSCSKDEGDLTVLRAHYVSEEYLCEVFDNLELETFVICGKSMKGELTPAIKGDIIESLIATIYLDGGIEEARKFVIEKLHIEDFENAKDENFKSQLQELIQANFKCSMKYVTEFVDQGFEAKFFMDEDLIATGYGHDKTKAEQNCAYVAIRKLFEE